MHEGLNEIFGQKDGDYKDCSVEILRTKKWQVFGNEFVTTDASKYGISVEILKARLESIQKRAEKEQIGSILQCN